MKFIIMVLLLRESVVNLLFSTTQVNLLITIKSKLIRLCKWLKQLDSKLSPVKGFMGSNPLSMMVVS